MKWKPISEYNTPDEDVLFRIEWEYSSIPYFNMGWINDEHEIILFEDPNGYGGRFCDVRTLDKRKIKRMWFLDPREIEPNR